MNVNPLIAPKKQPPRRPSKEHTEVVREEVTRLKQAEAIKEVFYPEWLANTVVVKKKSGKWRVCVDFTDLNKTCSKDPFPMPKIDQLVDATVGHPRTSFLNAFQGYHQIPLAWDDKKKNCFCYPYRELPLQSDVIRFEECRIHLSTNDDKDVRVAIGVKYRDLHK